MFAICAFNATSPCCLGTEVRRRAKFTGVELAAAVEKVATGPMEKATTDLARAATAQVEKAIRTLEKVAATGVTAEMEEGW